MQYQKLKNWLVKKVDTVIQKNPDINFFMNYSCVICLKNKKIFDYVPLVSVSAERSFSLLKMLLTDRRTNMTPEKFEILLILYYNKYKCVILHFFKVLYKKYFCI